MPEGLRLATAAMGTRFELLLPGPDSVERRAAGEAALEEVELWHSRLSRFAPDSLVSHLNRTAHATPFRLDRETFALFSDALAVHRDSGGAFDITVAPLLEAQGFPPSAVGGAGPVRGGALRLDARAGTVWFTQPGISLDLGAIAKGHALDRAAALLRASGIESALLHGGTSSVVAIGVPPAGGGWRIALGPEGRAGTLTLRDEALSVSDATSQRSRGREGGHILDARSGKPSTWTGLVAVIGPSARLCDAWSTAVVAQGTKPSGFPRGYQVIRQHSRSPGRGAAVPDRRGPAAPTRWRFPGFRRA